MKLSLSILTMFLVLLLIISSPVSAFKVIEAGDTITMDEVIDDDIYIAGGDISIKGTVLGDVIAAGGIVEITGNVTGDVVVAAGEVTINGNVGDDVRVVSGTLTVNGNIGDDLLAGTGELLISDDASIGGDLVFGSGDAAIRGDVGGNVTGGGEDVTLTGIIDGDVDLQVEKLNVLSSARINGKLEYSGPNEAIIPSGVVAEEVDFTRYNTGRKEMDDSSSPGLWIIKYLSLLVIALISLGLFPKRTIAISQAIPVLPLKNLAVGFLALAAALVGSLVLFITVIGIPAGLLLLFTTLFALYAVRIYFGLWLGKLTLSKLGVDSKPWMDMALGLFLLLILTSIPWIGGLLYLLVTLIAIGSIYYTYKALQA
ncbi:hypothetical protein V7O66_03115 [Methanolobus sp. ZRKC3]|uniref:hypothetical protein n=1 Tax=Methanolobus sp. ZRKC3 TaxID=3125786 RepID=UPI00324AD8EF